MEYTIPPRKKRTQRDYTMGFKLAVVEEVEKGQITYKKAQVKYGIQGRSTVLKWLRKHGRLDWSSPRGITMPKKQETPEQKIKRLEKELKDAQDLHYLQGEMIKKVDQLCGTDFEKKYLSSLPERLKPKGK